MRLRCIPKGTKYGFTLVELLVVISIIAMLLAVLVPSLSKARDSAKKVVCMSNQKQLVTAWTNYAVQNNGKLVPGYTTRCTADLPTKTVEWSYGAAGTSRSQDSWIPMPVFTSSFKFPFWASIKDYQNKMLQLGALYPYVKSVDIYRCPAPLPTGDVQTFNNFCSYAIGGMMNGYIGGSARECSARQQLVQKNLAGIRQPSRHLAFICQGGMAPRRLESFSVPVLNPANWGTGSNCWDDMPPAVHMRRTGTTMAYADGHTAYHRWQAPEIYDAVKYGDGTEPPKVSAFGSDRKDFDFVREAVWGVMP